MKKSGVFLNFIIKVAKALPVAIIVGAVFAMVAYIVCVSVFPLGYCSVAEFMPQIPQGSGIDGLEIVSTDAFYTHVADEYSAQRDAVTAEELKDIFIPFSESSGKIVFSVRASDPLTSYFIVKTALESAEYFYSVQEGSITVLSEASIPTSLTRDDITPYVICSAVAGFVAVLAIVIVKGLPALSSEPENKGRHAAQSE